MEYPLVLASTSVFRRELLSRLAIGFETAAPDYEEEYNLGLPLEELVQELAERKARSLVPRFEKALIIGSDQVAELDGQILRKPGTKERAVEQLLALQGRTHRLLTGVAIVDAASGRVERACDIHHMTMRPRSREQLTQYVDREQPLGCAGSYKVEGEGIALFSAMAGTDFSGIIGLPLTRVVELLERLRPGLL